MDAPKKIKWHNGLLFPSLQEGRDALIQHTLDNDESFRVVKADHKRFFTCCNSGPECRYQMRLYVRRDTTAARLQLFKPKHTCSPETHKGWVPPQYGPVEAEQTASIQPENQPAQQEAAPTQNDELSPQIMDHPVDAMVESTSQEKPKKSKKNKKNKKNVQVEEPSTQTNGYPVAEVGGLTLQEEPKKAKKNKRDLPSEEVPQQTVDDSAAAVVEVTPEEEPKKSKKSKKSRKDKEARKAAAAERELTENALQAEPQGHRKAAAERGILDWANEVAEHELTAYEKGLQTRREVLGDAHVERSLAANSNAFSRPMQEVITEFAWGNIWNREGLSRKQRSMINIALLTALNRTPELGMHIRGAINNGLSELEIRETIIHSTVYCGAPAGMEAARTAEKVLSEMQANGEHDRVLV